MIIHFPYLIIGGGIAGITAAETLRQLDDNLSIGLITCSDTVKTVTDLYRVTKLIEDFNVLEKSFEEVYKNINNMSIIKAFVDFINPDKNVIHLTDGRDIYYDQLCICTGGIPKLIKSNKDYVLGIRDVESVEIFKEKLIDCKRVAIIGNGGIATELIHELCDCELLWIIKDKYISATFFDSAAAMFFLKSLDNDIPQDKGAEKINKQRHRYIVDGKEFTTERKIINKNQQAVGGALGPDWAMNMTMRGCGEKHLEVLYEVEVISIETDKNEIMKLWNKKGTKDVSCEYNVALTLSNGSVHFCDLVISATGVIPHYPKIINGSWNVSDKDGGILVGENMETNFQYIYAAGDCCTPNWECAELWFQMRLWSQARNMAFQAAKSMFASQNNKPLPMLDFSFELFTHVTKFFGYSVVLLGLYNGQKLTLENNSDAELLIRTSPGEEYIKCVIVNGRIKGAMLIGDTELAETLENLILDEIDVSQYGEYLLDPNIDIADFFD